MCVSKKGKRKTRTHTRAGLDSATKQFCEQSSPPSRDLTCARQHCNSTWSRGHMLLRWCFRADRCCSWTPAVAASSARGGGVATRRSQDQDQLPMTDSILNHPHNANPTELNDRPLSSRSIQADVHTVRTCAIPATHVAIERTSERARGVATRRQGLARIALALAPAPAVVASDDSCLPACVAV